MLQLRFIARQLDKCYSHLWCPKAHCSAIQYNPLTIRQGGWGDTYINVLLGMSIQYELLLLPHPTNSSATKNITPHFLCLTLYIHGLKCFLPPSHICISLLCVGMTVTEMYFGCHKLSTDAIYMGANNQIT